LSALDEAGKRWVMKNIIKKYSNHEVTVVWQPEKCIHSAICISGLPNVFDNQKRPWVNIQGATSARIVEQVKQCPSGALSYFLNEGEKQEAENLQTVVEVLCNGPLLIHGTLKVKDKNGNEALKENTTAFCRCGASANKPYCDGSHIATRFKDE
jgi:uncharacterized Fe-S cluster protein YjdI